MHARKRRRIKKNRIIAKGGNNKLQTLVRIIVQIRNATVFDA
jgi:hypothetical protein